MRSDATTSRDRPLEDRRVAVTRPDDGAGGLADMLRASGAVVVLRPLIRIVRAGASGALHAAAARVAVYDWVVFTSANAVHALAAARPVGRPRHVAAVGRATAAVVRTQLGWHVTVVPDRHTGAAVVPAMLQLDALRGRRVLWPRAAAARESLGQQLIDAGADLDAPEAYRTEFDDDAATALHADVRADVLDAITFTSPSAIACFAREGTGTGRARIAVIGPTTAAAAVAAGLPVHVQPAHHTFAALVRALAEHFTGARPANDSASGDSA